MMLVRVPRAERLELESQAEATGRSMAHIAARLIGEGLRAEHSLERLLGGAAAAPTLRSMIELAQRVRERFGDAGSAAASSALSAGLIRLAEQLPSHDTALAELRAPLRALLTQLSVEVEAWPFDADPEFVRACADGEAFSDPAWTRRLRNQLNALVRVSEGPDGDLACRTLDAVDAYRDALHAYAVECLQATLFGHEVAAQLSGREPPTVDSAAILHCVSAKVGLAEPE